MWSAGSRTPPTTRWPPTTSAASTPWSRRPRRTVGWTNAASWWRSSPGSGGPGPTWSSRTTPRTPPAGWRARERGMMLGFQVTFDATDPDGLARFWAGGLGYGGPPPPGGVDSRGGFLRGHGIPEGRRDDPRALVD